MDAATADADGRAHTVEATPGTPSQEVFSQLQDVDERGGLTSAGGGRRAASEYGPNMLAGGEEGGVGSAGVPAPVRRI